MSRNPVLGFSVPNLVKPATALSDGAAPAGSLRMARVFPASGGAQLIDAAGNVTSIAGTTSGAALLAATQTFTGINTFGPADTSPASVLDAVTLRHTVTLPARTPPRRASASG